MDMRSPHDILSADEVPPGKRGQFLPLTAAEALDTGGMTPDQRAAWLRDNISTRERLARLLEVEGVPRWVIYNARRGRYDDFHENGAVLPQVELDKHLRKCGRFDLCKLVRAGAFDATADEAEAWARRQTGEVAASLEKLGLQPEHGDWPSHDR